VITVLLITFSIGVSYLFFPGISSSSKSAFDLSEIIKMVLDLIPVDAVSPFVENKTIQIIIIAIAVGVALLILDEKTPRLRGLVSEANQLIFTIMRFVSKIIPAAVFLSIYKTFALNDLSGILGVWKLVAAGYAIMVPFTAFIVLYVCIRRKINIREFLHDISGPAIVGLTTASGTLAMTKQFETAREVMKKDEKLVGFWVPLSHAMFSPSVVPPLVAAAFFAGNYYGTPISLPQILILYLLVTQLSIASPKVPGGIMATYTILLGQLGMPADVVGLLMVANVFIVNVQTGLAMVIRSAELEEFSHIIGSEKTSAAK
ncbi:MAG: cation:dicarboxylase symporter family transporter, partial [Lachnospiraceae bacterium]|nr:cation:dicarboxylase symporter family transporter [Lachnospiraceae bacterium]